MTGDGFYHIDTTALGDDAAKWAKAFCDCKQANNWTIEDIDESLMLGWFANAIEISDDTRFYSREAME